MLIFRGVTGLWAHFVGPPWQICVVFCSFRQAFGMKTVKARLKHVRHTRMYVYEKSIYVYVVYYSNKHICITYIISNIWCIKYHKPSIYHIKSILYIYIYIILRASHIYWLCTSLSNHFKPNKRTNHPELNSTSSHSPPRPRPLFDASSASWRSREAVGVAGAVTPVLKSGRFHQGFLDSGEFPYVVSWRVDFFLEVCSKKNAHHVGGEIFLKHIWKIYFTTTRITLCEKKTLYPLPSGGSQARSGSSHLSNMFLLDTTWNPQSKWWDVHRFSHHISSTP